MPLDTSVLGQSIPAEQHLIDARWLMAYAAGLGDLNPRYMDTEAHTVIGHPLFPVCVEWPVILNMRALAGSESLTAEEAARGVHAAHDLHLYAPIKAGDTLNTSAKMIGIQAIRPGAAYTMKLSTHNQDGTLVAETYQLGIYRGVAITGEPGFAETPPTLPELSTSNLSETGGGIQKQVFVPGSAAHAYTECAHIWNPIHTDRAVALSAGLPDIILHGTATMALALTEIVNEYANGDPGRVRRLGGRFAAMVLMPSTITVVSNRDNDVISYSVLTEDGQTAISDGFVVLGA